MYFSYLSASTLISGEVFFCFFLREYIGLFRYYHRNYSIRRKGLSYKK